MRVGVCRIGRGVRRRGVMVRWGGVEGWMVIAVRRGADVGWISDGEVVGEERMPWWGRNGVEGKGFVRNGVFAGPTSLVPGLVSWQLGLLFHQGMLDH